MGGPITGRPHGDGPLSSTARGGGSSPSLVPRHRHPRPRPRTRPHPHPHPHPVPPSLPFSGLCAVQGAGWVGLDQGLTWSPTRGPRRLPCGTRLGGRTRVSGHQASRTVDPLQTPAVALAGGRCRHACVYVPLCVWGGGGGLLHTCFLHCWWGSAPCTLALWWLKFGPTEYRGGGGGVVGSSLGLDNSVFQIRRRIPHRKSRGRDSSSDSSGDTSVEPPAFFLAASAEFPTANVTTAKLTRHQTTPSPYSDSSVPYRITRRRPLVAPRVGTRTQTPPFQPPPTP